MPKINAKKWCWKNARVIFHLPFWIDFWSGLGVWGLANFRLWQILGKTLGDFNSSLTRPAPQAGCGGLKTHAKTMQKWSSKNVCENEVKIVQHDINMWAKIVEISITNRLRNRYGNFWVDIAKKWTQETPVRGPRNHQKLRSVGPECR